MSLRCKLLEPRESFIHVLFFTSPKFTCFLSVPAFNYYHRRNSELQTFGLTQYRYSHGACESADISKASLQF